LFNRDSQDIPEIRRQPILPGMSGEERVSVARHALLFESRLTSAAFGRNQTTIMPHGWQGGPTDKKKYGF
jgi:hypothetical protein